MVLLACAALMVGMFTFTIMSAFGMFARPVADGSLVAPAVAAVPAVAMDPRTAAGQIPDLTAAELWSAYTRDAAAADRKYRQHSVQVTGTVRSIDRNFEGEMVIRLATPDPLESVNATLATRTDPVLNTLVKGRSASLLCVGRGAMMGAPMLGGCFVR